SSSLPSSSSSSSSSPSFPLILSRFSASVIGLITVVFFQVSKHNPREVNDVIIEFCKPNYAEDIPEFVDGYLRNLLNMMSNGAKCLSFVDHVFMAEIYCVISFYNNETLKRIVNEIMG
ncbi:hypothetical protein PFISCL1PPCAC_24359, partial [Pristionchus fissidentatus]